jgi:RNA polymerase sigma factor (sigma-70 family)
MNSASPAHELANAAEATMVALARMGDERAFAELVQRRQSTVRNLLRRLSRDGALADDLAQETFLQAWKQLSRLQSTGAFGGWLRQIAVNMWLQHLRSREHFVALEHIDEAAHTPAPGIRMDLDAALAQLAPAVRVCIVLSYHEGMSHGDIAAATDLPLGTIKSHITRGTARLRELLAAYDDAASEPAHA